MDKHRVYTPADPDAKDLSRSCNHCGGHPWVDWPTDLCPGVAEYGDCDGHLEAVTGPPSRGGVVMGMDFAADFKRAWQRQRAWQRLVHAMNRLDEEVSNGGDGIVAAHMEANAAMDEFRQAFGMPITKKKRT